MSGVATDTSTSSESVEPTAPETPGAAGAAGGGEGTQAADAFVAERERLQSQIKDFQSERDKARTELDRLKAAQPAGESGSPDPKPAETTLTAADIGAIVARATSLTQAAVELRSDEGYKHADPAIFARAHEFDSPEEFRVALAESHAARAAIFQAGFQAGQEGKADGGSSPDPGPAAAGSTAPTPGLPTKQALAAMDQDAYEAFVTKNGQAVVDEILRS